MPPLRADTDDLVAGVDLPQRRFAVLLGVAHERIRVHHHAENRIVGRRQQFEFTAARTKGQHLRRDGRGMDAAGGIASDRNAEPPCAIRNLAQLMQLVAGRFAKQMRGREIQLGKTADKRSGSQLVVGLLPAAQGRRLLVGIVRHDLARLELAD